MTIRMATTGSIKRDRSVGETRTTINLKTTTKSRLDENKAPGQCYDGFICQLVDLWEQTTASNRRLVNTSRM